jgi:hypothetical protein
MSQANTEIVIEVPIQKIKIKKNNKKNIVVETPIVETPIVELNDFTEDTGEEDDIDEKIQLTEEQLKELQKQKKEKELRKNIVALRITAKEIAKAKRQDILTKIEALQQEQLAIQDVIVSINNGEMDEELIAEELNKKEKTKKDKKQPTYEGKGKIAGTGKARMREVENLNAGKMTDKLTHSKIVNGKNWALLYEGRKDGGLAVYKCCDTNEYFIPNFKDVAKLIGEDIKTRSDYLEWIEEEN